MRKYQTPTTHRNNPTLPHLTPTPLFLISRALISAPSLRKPARLRSHFTPCPLHRIHSSSLCARAAGSLSSRARHLSVSCVPERAYSPPRLLCACKIETHTHTRDERKCACHRPTHTHHTHKHTYITYIPVASIIVYFPSYAVLREKSI